MSDDGEGPLSRWSRRKRNVRAGRPVAEAPGRDGSAPPAPSRRGAAAPVAGRRLVPSLPPLAGAEDDAEDPYRAEPIIQAYGLPSAPAAEAIDAADADAERQLTPEEQEAVKNLPPIESLEKDSDFTPFMTKNVPDFIRRKALRVLWRSDPVLANLDGLNDYDEDFTMPAILADALEMVKDAKARAKKKAKEKAKEKARNKERAREKAGDGTGEDAAAADKDNAAEAPGTAERAPTGAADTETGAAAGDRMADAGDRPPDNGTRSDAVPGAADPESGKR